jgi:energy-coupling factor transporter transmembrane protein EcfT
MVNKKRLKPYIPLMISLLFGLVLFFLVEDFLVRVIVQPLLRVVWFVSLIVQNLPQGVLWGGFIFIMLIVTFASFTKGKKPDSLAWQTPTKNPGTVEIWARLLENAQISKYSKWRLAQKLKRLTQELLSPTDGDERVNIDLSELELPVEIRAYFEEQQPSSDSHRERGNQKNEEAEMALDLDPEVVLQHLKKRLNL